MKNDADLKIGWPKCKQKPLDLRKIVAALTNSDGSEAVLEYEHSLGGNKEGWPQP